MSKFQECLSKSQEWTRMSQPLMKPHALNLIRTHFQMMISRSQEWTRRMNHHKSRFMIPTSHPTDPPPIETAPAVELQVPVTKTARTPEATPPPRRSTRVSKQPKSYLVNEKAYRLSFCETRQPRPYDIALPDRSSDSPRS